MMQTGGCFGEQGANKIGENRGLPGFSRALWTLLPPGMAINAWSSMPCKGLTQLGWLCCLARHFTSCPHFMHSNFVDECVARCQHSAMASAVAHHHHQNTRPFAVETGSAGLPKLTLSRQALCQSTRNPGAFSPANANSKKIGIHSSQLAPFQCHSGNSTVMARFVHTSLGVWAGHNKWSKVKYIKGPKDSQRSITFNKLILQMKVAIKGKCTQ